jgi:branched-chain amino acid transport system permease protein
MGPVAEPVRVERATRASRAFVFFAMPGLAALVTLPWWGGPGDMRLVGEMAYYLALAQLWNLLAGYAGLVSVGQQAYVGLGGYAFFYLTGALNVNAYVALLLAGPFAGLMSIPVSVAVFRLRGAYFAVGTWVVSEVFALSASLIAALGAGSGLSLTPDIVRQISPERDIRDTLLYLMSLASAVLVVAVVYLLLRSRHGLALTAIRDSEPASESLGVNTFRTKFIIYVVTATCTGLVGALIFLQKLRISPEAGFSINDWTVVVIFMVVIGGIGTIEGPFIGMLVYIVLRELLADYGTSYLILMGAIAIAVMLKAPFGIWGWVVQRYDLQLFPVGRRLALAPSDSASEPENSKPAS